MEKIKIIYLFIFIYYSLVCPFYSQIQEGPQTRVQQVVTYRPPLGTRAVRRLCQGFQLAQLLASVRSKCRLISQGSGLSSGSSPCPSLWPSHWPVTTTNRSKGQPAGLYTWCSSHTPWLPRLVLFRVASWLASHHLYQYPALSQKQFFDTNNFGILWGQFCDIFRTNKPQNSLWNTTKMLLQYS